MKIKIFLLTLIGIGVLSCNKKDDFNYPPGTVGISKITNYPTFTMTGNSYISLVAGSTYNEPGVKATEGGAPLTVTTTSSLNTNTPGIYVITYSAVNKDGFAGSVSRTVVVLPSAEIPGSDLSGKYDYVAGGTTSTITKVAPGVYFADNTWSALTTIPLVLVSLDGLNITIYNQSTPYGPANGTGTFTPATKRLVYKISLTAQGISNSTRTWQKQ